MKSWSLLFAAIAAEVVATSALKASEGFSRLAPSLIVVAGYGLAFYLLSRTLGDIPVGIAYAVWSGTGIALISLIGWLVYKQALNLGAIIGILLILAGVVMLNIYSSPA